MKKYLYGIFAVAVLLFFMEKARAQDNSVLLDFAMQDIQDIAYAVSVAQGISIVCDDAVTKKTSFRLPDADFDQAAQGILLSNRLYAKMQDGQIVLSKMIRGTAKNVLGTKCIAESVLQSL